MLPSQGRRCAREPAPLLGSSVAPPGSPRAGIVVAGHRACGETKSPKVRFRMSLSTIALAGAANRSPPSRRHLRCKRHSRVLTVEAMTDDAVRAECSLPLFRNVLPVAERIPVIPAAYGESVLDAVHQAAFNLSRLANAAANHQQHRGTNPHQLQTTSYHRASIARIVLMTKLEEPGAAIVTRLSLSGNFLIHKRNRPFSIPRMDMPAGQRDDTTVTTC